MPLSDLIRSVLQNIQYAGTAVAPLMGNNWQQASQEMQNRAATQQQAQAQATQQQFQNQQEQARFAQTQKYQDAEIEDKRQQNIAALRREGYDISLKQEGPSGGPGLNGEGPSIGAGGGQMQSNQPNVPPQIATTQGILNGMQGAPSQTPNAANQSQNAGLVAQRFAGAPTASQGGVVIPTASQTQGVMPTAFDFPGPGGKTFTARMAQPQQDKYTISIPPALRGAFGGQDTYTTSDPVEARGIREKAMEFLGKQQGEQKEPNLDAQALQAAIAKVNPNGKTIMDVPPESRGAVLDDAKDMSSGAAGRAEKAEKLSQQQDRDKAKAIQQSSDDVNYGRLKKDPLFIFNSSLDKDQRARLELRAAAQGVDLPTRDPAKVPQLNDRLEASQEVQAQTQWMHNLYQKIGPQNFGALIGRVKIAEGAAGAPIVTFSKGSAFKSGDKTTDGTPLATLEEEFRDHATWLTQNEVRANGGGGRAAVMLVNMAKGATPQQWKDPSFLEGAFRSTWNRAQMIKNGINDYAYGRINDVPKNMNLITGKRFPGERVKFKSGETQIVDKVNSDGTWHSHAPEEGE